MNDWIRFEDGRSRRHGLEYGTIMKDGRLVIGNDMAIALGLLPGTHVELYYRPTQKQIGFLIVPSKTPHSLTVVSTGPKDHPFNEQVPGRKALPGVVIAIRSFLNSRHIGLASKVKGHIYFEAVSNMVIFEFPDAPQVITPSVHAGEQMQKLAFTERVVGDRG